MDERAQDLEQRQTCADRQGQPFAPLPAARPEVLPRAAGGGAGGIAVEVRLGAEPAEHPAVSEPEADLVLIEPTAAEPAPALLAPLPSVDLTQTWLVPEPPAVAPLPRRSEPDHVPHEATGESPSTVVPTREVEAPSEPELPAAQADIAPPALPDVSEEAETAEPPTIAPPPPPEPEAAPALLTQILTVALIRPLDVPAPPSTAPVLPRTEPQDRQDAQPATPRFPEETPTHVWYGGELPPALPIFQRIQPDDLREPEPLAPIPEAVPPHTPSIPRPGLWPPALPLPAPGSRTGHRLRLALTLLLAVAGGLAALVLALALLYRWVDPPMSTLMLSQQLAGMPASQRWVPLERISPNLSAAVITSEDAHFCHHHGVDWGELKEAIESAGDGLARGGSTITMQVVKNLFLWPSRSYVRKAMEIPLAFVVEALWPKRRILEIYLNIAEWGPGVFGAEAAARYHFRKPALVLSPREAALLAVSLPNPIDRQAGRPGPGTQRLADRLMLRMRAASAATACVRGAAGRR